MSSVVLTESAKHKANKYRAKYPKYKDIDDEKLADGLYKAFVQETGEFPQDEFYSYIGLELIGYVFLINLKKINLYKSP